MYRGIVLDKIQRNTFLSMAAQDKLIYAKGQTDGVFDMVTRQVPLLKSSQIILEQLMVAGAVYVDPFIYGCMDGELIEKGIILPYQKCEDEIKVFFAFDIDIIQRMMEEKGFDTEYYTVDKIEEIFYELRKKAKEFLELEQQYDLNYTMIQIQKTFNFEPKRNYNDIDIDYFVELGNYLYHNPVFEVLREYMELFNIAYYNDLLSPVNNSANFVLADSPNMSIRTPVATGNNAVKILRYTSKKLDRIYTAASLKDCVKLVQTDESKAYRNKVDEWLSSFSNQSYENLQRIEADIAKAQKAMRYKRILENTGKICATAGVFATAITPVVPPAGIISIMATVISLPSAFIDPMKRYLWASFGMYHNRQR